MNNDFFDELNNKKEENIFTAGNTVIDAIIERYSKTL